MKKASTFFFVFLLTVNAFAQQKTASVGFDLSNYGVRIEPDARVMTVMAALETARHKDENGADTAVIKTVLSPTGEEFRANLQTDLPAVPADLRQKITSFVEQYKKRHPKETDAQIVAPFIAMAYSLTPAPELADPVITNDLPGDLLDVLDFAPLVREFYRRSGFSAKLAQYLKTYRQSSDGQLRQSSRQLVGDLLDYLHTRPQTTYLERVKTTASKAGKNKPTLEKVETRERERRFYIVPELLMPQNSVKLINVRDDYFVVTPPNADLNQTEARRAFLQFVVDPLVANNAKDVFTFSPLIKNMLAERRKTNADISPDIYLAVSRSLVAAIDARETAFRSYNAAVQDFRSNKNAKPLNVNAATKTSKLTNDLYLIDGKYALPRLDDEIALRLSEDYKKGAVLDFYFAEQLKGTENSGFDIASSLRDMILSLETAKEATRLEQYADAANRARIARKSNSDKPIEISNPVTVRLLEIEKTIQTKNYAQANSDLTKLVGDYPSDPRVYYTIGRVNAFSAESAADDFSRNAKLKEAQTAYVNVLRTATEKTDKSLLSLTYVALAKIYAFVGEKDYAIKIFDKAIEIGDVNGGAYSEAIAGKQKLIAK